MRHNDVGQHARKAIALFASATLVAGLYPAAAFGEVDALSGSGAASEGAPIVEPAGSMAEGAGTALGETGGGVRRRRRLGKRRRFP